MHFPQNRPLRNALDYVVAFESVRWRSLVMAKVLDTHTLQVQVPGIIAINKLRIGNCVFIISQEQLNCRSVLSFLYCCLKATMHTLKRGRLKL